MAAWPRSEAAASPSTSPNRLDSRPAEKRWLQRSQPSTVAAVSVGVEADMQLALRVSDQAAQLALRYFQDGVSTTIKADGSPVSEADPAVEKFLVDELSAARPSDAIVGEELGTRGKSARRWILDPIDGTSCFCSKNPHWRVHVALEINGRIDIAVVTAPALARQWWANRGSGTETSPWPRRLPPERLHVSTTESLDHAVLDARKPEERDRLPEVGTRRPEPPSAWCSGLIDLIHGRVDCFFVQGCQLWDHAPWVLLVEEAGGRFTDHHGGTSPDHHGGLYSNGHLHEQLLPLIDYPI